MTCQGALTAATVSTESTLHTPLHQQQVSTAVSDDVIVYFENISSSGATSVFSPLSCDNNSDYQLMQSSRYTNL